MIALEEDRHLLDLAWPALERLALGQPGVGAAGGRVACRRPGTDMILLEGSVAEIPAVLDHQLRADGGRLATVLSSRPGVGQAVIAEPTGVGLGAPTRPSPIAHAGNCSCPEAGLRVLANGSRTLCISIRL